MFNIIKCKIKSLSTIDEVIKWFQNNVEPGSGVMSWVDAENGSCRWVGLKEKWQIDWWPETYICRIYSEKEILVELFLCELGEHFENM